jgi:cysteine-rich repeat protein
MVMCVLGCSHAPAVVCGDGVVGHGETCDDGNAVADDGCASYCETEEGYVCPSEGGECTAVCGDGIVVASEVCDSAGRVMGYCSADCAMTTGSCGDGVVQTSEHEDCDDTNGRPEDGCNVCHASFGWTCDATTHVCSASSLDSSLVISSMTDAQRMAFCEWQISFIGPVGHVWACSTNNFTVRSVAACMTAVANYPASVSHCTVGDVEAWTAERRDACDFFTNSSAPCPPATPPACSQLDISCSTARPTCDAGMVPEVTSGGLCWTGTCVPQTSCGCTNDYDCPSRMCNTTSGLCRAG